MMAIFRKTMLFIGLTCVAVTQGAAQPSNGFLQQGGRPVPSLEDLLGPDDVTNANKSAGPRPIRRGPAVDPPPPATIAAADKQVREAFRVELTAAGNDPVKRKQLVLSLTGAADDRGIETAQRWASLELAIEVAAKGSDPELLSEALEARDDWFSGQDSLGPMEDFLRSTFALRRGDPTELLEKALQINRDALVACRTKTDRLTIAQKLIDLAEEMTRQLPAQDQDRLRPSVRKQRAETDEIASICDSAANARRTLLEDPENAAANTILGFQSAWAGDWDTANMHLQKAGDSQFRAAAKAEREDKLVMKRVLAEAFKVAGLWWESVQEANDAGVLDPRPEPRPSSLARIAIRQHAAKIYEEALPGLDNLFDRKLAESRIAEANQLMPAKVLPQQRPQAWAAAFDRVTFNAAEVNREKLFADLGKAVQKQDQRWVTQVQDKLTVVRRQWAEALHLHNRDMALPERRERIAEILQRTPDFGDGWLCDCFLKMLAGDRTAAIVSFDKAVDLMRQGPRQVFAGQQYLDAAEAALSLGKVEDATKLKNNLQKRFPNDLGVKFLAARIAVEKKLFTNANEIFGDLMKEQNLHPVIVAEYAWFKAANPVDRLRDVKAAEVAIERTLGANHGPLWKALRARAAVLAAAGRWDQALETLDEAERQAPLLFAEEFQFQRAEYLKRQEYFFGR